MVLTLESIGEYQLQHSLGTDALGETFLAHHALTSLPFLVRIFPEELSCQEDFLYKLKVEMQQLSSIDHPHIVKIHSVSHTQNRYALITESVADAEPLDRWLHQRTLQEDQIITILRQLASALDYLHHKVKTYHGSITLSSILIHELEGEICVKLTDLAMAKIIGALPLLSKTYAFLAASHLEEAHTTFQNTYPFLAPEYHQYPLHITSASDIYAFGILSYYLLAGSFPKMMSRMPSLIKPWKYSWDPLITHCLQEDKEQRATDLKGLVDQVTSTSSHSNQNVYGFSLQPVIKPCELKRPSFEPDPGAIFHTETVIGKYSPKVETLDIAPLTTQMVIIPEGHYQRGCNTGARDELSRHTIFLNAFAIDIHPVTNEQFVRFLEAMGGEKDSNNNDMIRLRDSRLKRSAGKLSIESGYTKHPVVGVSWYGAVAYAKWVGKRLPSEAEWEVAAYGGKEEGIYPTGNQIERRDANFFSSDTTAVTSYPPNGIGLYDMAGNVYEWCEDWYDHRYYDLSIQEPNNPKGPLQGIYRVLRGGCWKSLKEDLRCAHRHRNNPGIMNGTYGFRCATDVV